MTSANSIGSATIGGAEGGWWERERASFIVDRLRRGGVRPALVIDLGCGRAAMEPVLARGLDAFVVGCDGERHPTWRPEPGAWAYVVADIRRPPFRPGVADLVTAFDVIEHFADDQQPLATMVEVVRPTGGHVAVTVPANPSLWSRFDDEVGHFRRYTAPALEASSREAGVEPIDTTHFFAWLVPPAWLLRRRSRQEADAPAVGPLGRLVGAATATAGRLERRATRGRRSTVGTSLWLLGRPATR